MEFKNTLKADPYFNAMRLKFGYAITCHKAQGSEWNNVFVKCKSHQSQLTVDYFRWLYTAITRTAKSLYLLDSPNIQPWSDIKIISNPTQLDSCPTPTIPPSQPYTQNPDTFDIPESAAFLLSVLTEVRKLIDGRGITIEAISHHQYKEAYHFKRETESVRIDISYNSKSKISGVTAYHLSGLSTELVTLLSPLKGQPLSANSSSDVAKANFSKTFLNDFHKRLLELSSTAGITIQQVEEQQWCQRYSFTKDGAIATYDIWYNGRDRFTKCQHVIAFCSPGPLVSEVGKLITVGMQA